MAGIIISTLGMLCLMFGGFLGNGAFLSLAAGLGLIVYGCELQIKNYR